MDKRARSHTRTKNITFSVDKLKKKVQEPHTAHYWRTLLSIPRNNWSSIASKLVFAHNPSVSYANGKTSCEIVFWTKPQIPMFLKLSLYQSKHNLCCSGFCNDLAAHSPKENCMEIQLLDNLLPTQLSQILLERGRGFKQTYTDTFENAAKRQLGLKISVAVSIWSWTPSRSWRERLKRNPAPRFLQKSKSSTPSLVPSSFPKRITNTT